MPEKDRFGDKLREKERGEEAQYFAKRDRELVERPDDATVQEASGRAKLRTIVAATDFSDNAEMALAWAEQLARQHHATLILVHASGFGPVVAPDCVPLAEEYYDQVRTSATAQLEREAEKARRGGAMVECELGFGLASEVVIAAAQRYDADVIVAGTRGHTGWKRLFLGSTAARLVRQAHCPVLTIHRSEASAPRPIRTILVATDFSEDAALAMQAATRILEGTGDDRRIVLLHAYRVPFEASYLPGPVLMDAISAVDVDVKQKIEGLVAKLTGTGIHVDTAIREGYPPEQILEQARSVRADLISMGTHGRSNVDRLFLGSTAERVLGSAPCPVLTVRGGSST